MDVVASNPWPRRLFAGAAVVVPLIVLGSYFQQALYPAPRVPVPSPPPPPLEEVVLRLADGGTAVGWVDESAAAPGRPIVLFFHGNGENLETMRMVGLFEDVRRLGAPVLAVDYPGYGRSPGRPSEEGLMATGEAALTWAAARWPDRPIVACGWSLGAAVAVPLAAREEGPGGRVAGLAALSPWTSLGEVARVHVPFGIAGLLLRERYDSLEAAARVRVPALVVHGRYDTIIPFDHGRRLAAALPQETTRFVPVESGHNDLFAQDVVWRELGAFVDRVAAGTGAGVESRRDGMK